MVDVTDADGSKVAESAEGEGNPVGARPALGFMPGYESSEPGVPVNMVTEGGPAEKAGMQAGDQIVELNGEELFDINDYVAVLNALRIGSKVEVKIMRDGKANKLNVVVGER
ncbi:MAG: PDZ domain-containing protein [Planctomycetes bacterium]|nr:PDZ domain-containing protein [Planctomycetota bacterium]